MKYLFGIVLIVFAIIVIVSGTRGESSKESKRKNDQPLEKPTIDELHNAVIARLGQDKDEMIAILLKAKILSANYNNQDESEQQQQIEKKVNDYKNAETLQKVIDDFDESKQQESPKKSRIQQFRSLFPNWGLDQLRAKVIEKFDTPLGVFMMESLVEAGTLKNRHSGETLKEKRLLYRDDVMQCTNTNGLKNAIEKFDKNWKAFNELAIELGWHNEKYDKIGTECDWRNENLLRAIIFYRGNAGTIQQALDNFRGDAEKFRKTLEKSVKIDESILADIEQIMIRNKPKTKG